MKTDLPEATKALQAAGVCIKDLSSQLAEAKAKYETAKWMLVSFGACIVALVGLVVIVANQ